MKSTLQAVAKDSGSTGLAKQFASQAAATGVTLPSSVQVASVTAQVTQQDSPNSVPISVDEGTQAEKAAKEMQKVAAINAAVAVLKQAEVDKANAVKKEEEMAKPYEVAKATALKAKEGVEDVTFKLESAEKKVEGDTAKEQQDHVNQQTQLAELKAETSELGDAKVAMLAATDAQKAAVNDADKASAQAKDEWSKYLKAFADQKSADAKAPGVTNLDSWNKLLAEATAPQKNKDGADCSSVGAKFKTIIYLARDEVLKKAKESCVAKGNMWSTEFNARVETEVNRRVNKKVAERLQEMETERNRRVSKSVYLLEAADEFSE